MLRISYDEPPRPGNHASGVPQYRAKSALRSPARPNTARSYADETWPGVSYPSGDSTLVSSAPSARALSCIRAAVARQPPLREASTRTASLPELRNTPRHRSAIRYVRPSATPTRLLPGPIPTNSSSLTVCGTPAGMVGSRVRANSVFKVLAGGSFRCASCAASTSPVSASATSQDSAESRGGRGTSGCGRAWVPGRYSSAGRGVATCCPPGGSGSCPVETAAAVGASTSMQAAHSAQAGARAREANPIFIPST